MKFKKSLTILTAGACIATSAIASNPEEDAFKGAASFKALKVAKKGVRAGKEKQGTEEASVQGYQAAVEAIRLLPQDIKSGKTSFYKLLRTHEKCLKKLSNGKKLSEVFLAEANAVIEQESALFELLKQCSKEEKSLIDEAARKFRQDTLGLAELVLADSDSSETLKGFSFGKKNTRSARRGENTEQLFQASCQALLTSVRSAPKEMETGQWPFFKLLGSVRKSLSKLKKYGERSEKYFIEADTFYNDNKAAFERLKSLAAKEKTAMRTAEEKYRASLVSE